MASPPHIKLTQKQMSRKAGMFFPFDNRSLRPESEHRQDQWQLDE